MPSFFPPVVPADRKRLLVVSVFFSILFCLLIIRFYQIQIVQADRWTRIALAQHQYVMNEPFMRGSFYSNTSIKEGHPDDEQPFVIDVLKFHLFIDPESIPAPAKDRMAKQLCDLLNIPAKERGKVKSEFEKKSRSRKIASWLDREKKASIDKWWSAFCKKEAIVRNAIYFTSDYQRSYPFGNMLGAVLHTVQDEKDPQTHQALPTGGLEMLFNSYLKGKMGKRLIVRSPRHPLDTGKVLEEPENGADVYLTINHYLQAIAESELAKGVRAANAKGGWAVMMDPHTGEILALAQVPTFNPSRYADYYNNPQLQEYTKVKAVTDCFEPGSIFKPITIAVGLKASEELQKRGEKPLLLSDEWIPSSNGWFPGRSHPIKEIGRTHRALNIDLAIQKSSNIYMGKVAQRIVDKMGDQWYRKALMELFGFGLKTNIELPAENFGNVPTPGKLHPNGKLEWSLPTPYSLAMGHNILVNSIQLVRAYGILANGGYEVEPHLVKKIVKKKNGKKEILVDRSARKPKKQVLSSDICKTVIRSLKFVTKEGGTSKRADIHGYTEAGKSGTAEKIIDGVYSKEHNISSFVGFAPAKNPRFVLIVSLDEPEKKLIPGVGKNQMGGVCAAPIFKEIGTRALQYLGVAPDDPYGYPVGDPRRDPKKADWIAEVQALKEAYTKHNE